MAQFAHSEVWWSSVAVCPFFRRVRQKGGWPEIVCEGVFDTVSTTSLRFLHAREYDAYLERYCCDMNGCTRCPVHRIVADKYAKDGSLKGVR